MKIIIPIHDLRERLLPYDEMFQKSNITHDMIYNVACYALWVCFEHKNFSEAFVRDKADMHSWEIFSESGIEHFGEDKTYQEIEAAMQVATMATVDTALELAKYCKGFDAELCNKILDTDGYIVPEEANGDNLILEVIDSEGRTI